MTKRTEEKELYLASLRGDAKTRACTKKGKPCGGRCIPAHWNCRLKGEGETAPTRGNLATLPTELKNKIAARRRGESLSKFTKLALAAGGAAAAGERTAHRGRALLQRSRLPDEHPRRPLLPGLRKADADPRP